MDGMTARSNMMHLPGHYPALLLGKYGLDI
jgi:hypothetical protein